MFVMSRKSKKKPVTLRSTKKDGALDLYEEVRWAEIVGKRIMQKKTQKATGPHKDLSRGFEI